MNNEKTLYIFVYGSLKKEFYNDYHLEGADYIDKCSTVGNYTLYKTSAHPFPFLLNQPYSSIKGELYKVDTLLLKKLDQLEGYPHLYTREVINVKTHSNAIVYEAIAYFLNDHEYIENEELVKIDEWTKPDEIESL